MQRETFIRKLYCPLTPEEKMLRGGELASKMEERERVELELTEVKQTFKSRIKGLDNEVVELKQIVLEGRERREIECYARADFENDRMEFIRTDTHIIFESRRMTDAERQQFLPLVDEALRKLDEDDKNGRGREG